MLQSVRGKRRRAEMNIVPVTLSRQVALLIYSGPARLLTCNHKTALVCTRVCVCVCACEQ